MTFNISSWKTTLAGLAAAAASVVVSEPQDFPHWAIVAAKIIMAGGIAGLGLVAKDSNVTGGSVANTTNKPDVVAGTAK